MPDFLGGHQFDSPGELEADVVDYRVDLAEVLPNFAVHFVEGIAIADIHGKADDSVRLPLGHGSLQASVVPGQHSHLRAAFQQHADQPLANTLGAACDHDNLIFHIPLWHLYPHPFLCVQCLSRQ